MNKQVHSTLFNLWKKLLAKRKNSFAIKILCIFIISVATVSVWVIRLQILLAIFTFELFVSASHGDNEPSSRKKDDPFSDFSMSNNGYD